MGIYVKDKELQKKARATLGNYKEGRQLTQKSLAEEFGVSRITIASWLSGRQNFSGMAIKLLKMKGILS